MVDAIYTLKSKISRVLIPELIKVLSLSMLFYGAIMLNLFLLNITLAPLWHIIILTTLFILSCIQSYLKIKKLPTYSFFNDRITDNKSTIYFNKANLSIEKNLLDKIFETETFVLADEFKMHYIQANNQTYTYIQSLIQYARGEQNGL